MVDLLAKRAEMKMRIEKIEGILSASGKKIKEIKLLMSILGIDVYSAMGIYSDIGAIGRFPNMYKFATFAVLFQGLIRAEKRDAMEGYQKTDCHC